MLGMLPLMEIGILPDGCAFDLTCSMGGRMEKGLCIMEPNGWKKKTRNIDQKTHQERTLIRRKHQNINQTERNVCMHVRRVLLPKVGIDVEELLNFFLADTYDDL